MTYLLVKIFSIDDETVGALLRWTNSEVRHVVHHLLHAEPIQFSATKFFIAVVICQSERKCQSCSLLTKTSQSYTRDFNNNNNHINKTANSDNQYSTLLTYSLSVTQFICSKYFIDI